jgi:hypothetical protein
MLRVTPWIVSVLVATAAGCTLAFDTGSVEFDEPRRDGGNEDADVAGDPVDPSDADSGDIPDGNGPDTGPKPVEGLGSLCGIDSPLCLPEDDDRWPDCAHEQCRNELENNDALCLFATSPYGYCSKPCAADSQCRGDQRNPFTASMRCATGDDDTGYCVPGSQDDCAADASCPEGEVCKLARTVFPGGLNLGRACQTRTSGGVGPGEPCVDDPRRSADEVLRLCENDFCFDDVCAAFCDPETATPETCGKADLSCRTDYLDLLDFSTLRRSPPPDAGLCLPRTCQSPSECDDEAAVCTPGLTERAADMAEEGVCRADNPASFGSGALGDPCLVQGTSDDAGCGSRYCAGFPPNYYCSSLCDSDADCGGSQICAIETLFDGDNSRYYTRICRYATGSKARCDRNTDPACPGGEICAPFVIGDVIEGGSKLSGAHAEGRCVAPVQGGIVSGNACGQQECVAPDACVRFQGDETPKCVTVCGNGFHCSGFDICLAQAIFVQAEDTAEGEDLVLGICSQ